MSVGFEVMYNVQSTNAICKSTSEEQIMVYGAKITKEGSTVC